MDTTPPAGQDPDSDHPPPHERMTFAEICAPVHKEFAESGMTEEELLRFLEEVRDEARQEKRQRQQLDAET